GRWSDSRKRHEHSHQVNQQGHHGFCGSPPCGSDAGAPIPPCGLTPIVPIDPGVKQVTRPLLATRNAAGHAPLVTCCEPASPCASTVNRLPAEFPATPTDIPGMS